MVKINSIRIQGYRPFKDMTATFQPLEVLVGANGSGKTSLFEFLKFLRDSLKDDIPSEIVGGSIGQRIFHAGGPDKFWWSLEIDLGLRRPLRYQGELLGPVGATKVVFERVISKPLDTEHGGTMFLNVQNGVGRLYDPEIKRIKHQDITLKRPNQLALGRMNNPAFSSLNTLREYIEDWRFFSSFKINNERLRQPVPIEQEPELKEDASNLSSVLHFLFSEHPAIFEELQTFLRLAVPGFKRLSVKARGGPGQVLAFWQETGQEKDELSLADLSDGVLRLVSWFVLCLHPSPPPLICIDEPDQGVHPRTLPILAGLFERASANTQLILATHASYFLLQFRLENIAVMRKEMGKAVYIKPETSKWLRNSLDEFGNQELEMLHRNDELERLI